MLLLTKLSNLCLVNGLGTIGLFLLTFFSFHIVFTIVVVFVKVVHVVFFDTIKFLLHALIVIDSLLDFLQLSVIVLIVIVYPLILVGTIKNNWWGDDVSVISVKHRKRS